MREAEQAAPTIYMNNYYQWCQLREVQMPEIVQDILDVYKENYMSGLISDKMLRDFENVKGILCFKIINL